METWEGGGLGEKWLGGLGIAERRARAGFDRRPTHTKAGY